MAFCGKRTSMSEDLELILSDLGLSTKEVTAYLTLLQLGESSASEIAKVSGLKRATTYLILAQLVEKDLADSWTRGNREYFRAASPLNLKSRQQKVLNSLESQLPHLLALHKGNKRGLMPQVKIYSGMSELQEIWNRVETSTTPIRMWADGAFWCTPDSELEEEIRSNRVKNGVWLMGLIPYEPDPIQARKDGIQVHQQWYTELAKRGKKELRDFRFYNRNSHSIKCEILIFEDVIAYVSFGDLLGVTVTNQLMVDCHAASFDLAFSAAFSDPSSIESTFIEERYRNLRRAPF